jgi:Mlc titration factor MtfA (ptsG expression regulator)
MPFDTTYYINQHNNNTALQITVPGGIDTAIFVEPDQLPSHLQSILVEYDSILSGNHPQSTNYESLNSGSRDYGPLFVIAAFLLIFIISKTKRFKSISNTISRAFGEDEVIERRPAARTYLTYYGDELDFTDQQVSKILFERFPYFKSLSFSGQGVFIERLLHFMADKTFKIHDEKGFKEMPVLVSAAAIQLSFGLKRYLLPHFKYIHIHPQEFLRVIPILCFLEGNVSGNSINLSWKHFLEGYANPNDGQNVGLHELAHALHYQTFVVERNVDKGFRNLFDNFHIDGNKAYHTEKTVAGGLYSEYAEKNFQEFWAESVEIFFEKPAEMRSHYPKLYETMKQLLNQDPVNHIPSLGGYNPG